MAQKTRSIWGQVVRNFLNSLRPRKIWGNHVGTDYMGTKYFEIPIEAASARTRPSRYFEPAVKDDFQQELPPEWEAWLRGRRKEPPSEEEIMKNLAIMKLKKKNAVEVEAKAGKKTPMLKGMETFPKLEGYETIPGQRKQ